MNTIDNYFETSKLLCKSNNIYIKNDFLNNNTSKKSILAKHKNNLKKILEDNNNLKNSKKLNQIYYFNKNPVLNQIQTIYENLLINGDIPSFVQKLFSLEKKINKKNSNNNIKANPFFKSEYIQLNSLFVSSSNNLIQNIHIKKQLNLLVQGIVINNNSPSLGILKNINSSINKNYKNRLGTKNFSQMTQFFSEIKNIYIHEDKTNNSFFFLPIQNINLGETLNSLLTNGNNEKKLIIIEYVNNLESNINNLKYLPIQSVRNKVQKRILNPKYFIPYYFKDNIPYKIEKNKISSYLKKPDQYFKIYNELIQVINIWFNKEPLKKYKLMYDKIAYLILFQHIQLFYDLYYHYIDNITKYIISLKQSNNSAFKNLNYEACFDYLKKLNHGLLNYKKFLLNNAYQLFKPSKMIDIYGISFDEERKVYDIKDSIIFFGKEIEKKYPILLDNNIDLVYNFMSNFINSSSQTDIYSKEKLFIGTQYMNGSYLDDSLSTLDYNINEASSFNKFNKKIIEIIIETFSDCIPIELLSFLNNKKQYFIQNNLEKKQKIQIGNYILSYFKENIKKSTHFILLQSKSNINSSSKKKYFIISKMYYLISYFLFRIVETSMLNIELKNNLIEKMTKIKELYLTKISTH